jgi:radical SAM superfamily enzyme YgiQ (UPF0313 family)
MEQKNILLVYPEFPETYWSFKSALSFVGKRALMPPLGLATVAALLPEHYSCTLIDMNVEKLNDKDIIDADLVMISAMTVQKESMQDVIDRCGRLKKEAAVGGPYATSSQTEISGADYFVLNEGEITIPRFIKAWEEGTAEKVYSSTEKPDITQSPIPRFDLMKLKYYDTLPLQYSRGCPFNCEFCDIVHLFGHKPRTKTPDQFTAELDSALEVGFKGAVFIVDDNFIGNKRKVKELLNAIIVWQEQHGYPFKFCTETSIDLADDEELLDLMAKAQFYMTFVGIETPNDSSLSETGKVQNMKRSVSESVRKIQERGIEVTGGFIIGFDSDDETIFDRQIEFIKELAVPTAMIGLLMALPHTRLYNRLEKEGRILSKSNGNNTHQVELNFKTKMPEEILLQGYRKVLTEVYRPKTYFDRCLAVIKRYRDGREKGLIQNNKGYNNGIKWRELTGFFRSLFRQTFSRHGKEYIKFLNRALKADRKNIVRIVTLAVQGFHFFTITQKTTRSIPEPKRESAQFYEKGKYRGMINQVDLKNT